MKIVKSTPALEVKVTLIREALTKRNLKALQSLTKKMNLSTGLGQVVFSREQLIDNLVALGEKDNKAKIEKTIQVGKGLFTPDQVEAMGDDELKERVLAIGFNIADKKPTRSSMIETLLTYRGVASVFPAPADKAKTVTNVSIQGKTAQVIFNTLAEGILFHYPTSETKYKIVTKADGKVVIQNLATEKLWNLKNEKELNRSVIVVA